MTKKTKYFLWSILIFVISTRHVRSMEQAKKDDERIMKILLHITPKVPTEIAKMIIEYKNNIKEEQKAPVPLPHLYFPFKPGPPFYHYEETNNLMPNTDKNEPIFYPFS